jgi:PAS domain S-box-containing protein
MERRAPALAVCAIWLLVICWLLPGLGPERRFSLGLIATAAAVATFLILSRAERTRWIGPAHELADRIQGLAGVSEQEALAPPSPEFDQIAASVEHLRDHFHERLAWRASMETSIGGRPGGAPLPVSEDDRQFENTYSPESGEFNLAQSGDFSTVDMVNRLDPDRYVWIESSVAEQDFLGWTLNELRTKSFLDIVNEEDRGLAANTLKLAIDRGESLGQVVRIVTASGVTKDIELNVGSRYGSDRRISHLRCHLTDVTEKVRAERELRLRTRELTDANQRLVRMNRELEELKDLYSDLYENAPAMYLSLNPAGEVIECNRTLLTTLEMSRRELIGRPFERLLPDACRSHFRDRFEALRRDGVMEMQTACRKSDGETIEVWINASLVHSPGDRMGHARCVAQDVTARCRLEAELARKNQSLGHANAELSQKNRELDDFVYVVSHDLQEPLRTLIAFSDFLLKDYGDRFDAEGREYVNYLIDASRRMRAMILAMLNLSRAGKIVDELTPVELDELLPIVKSDLTELLRARNAELRIEDGLPTVWGDWNRLSQLFANLISNGLKFNRNEIPRVEVGVVDNGADAEQDGQSGPVARRDERFVMVYVRDNGIGIDPEFHETIFQLFRRLHTQEEYEGTGAGLAICSKIVRALGGRIRLESRRGAGSTFFIQLRRCDSEGSSFDQVMASEFLTAAARDEANDSRTV